MDNKELQIQILAVAQVLENVNVKGYDNLANLASCINTLRMLAKNLVPPEPKEE
jgi:hypothetical protein